MVAIIFSCDRSIVCESIVPENGLSPFGTNHGKSACDGWDEGFCFVKIGWGKPIINVYVGSMLDSIRGFLILEQARCPRYCPGKGGNTCRAIYQRASRQ